MQSQSSLAKRVLIEEREKENMIHQQRGSGYNESRYMNAYMCSFLLPTYTIHICFGDMIPRDDNIILIENEIYLNE